MLSQQSDPQLVATLQSGDLDALGILYDRYGEAVYRLALRMLANNSDAEDLTQEVFIALWRRGKYDPRRGSLLVYLMTMTRARAIDRLQTARSQQHLLEKYHERVADKIDNPAMESATLTELSHRVKAAIKELPSSQQQVLEMAYYGGMSQSEIATNLQVPLGTIKTRARQGLMSLRQMLRDLVEN
jgi:RNA polymerase sigma-70 factor, ECF subfamily